MQCIFSLKNAQMSIAGNVVLEDISLNIHQGEHLVISGFNGSGKTTLCKAIAGKCFVSAGLSAPVGIQYQDIKMISFTDDGKLFHSINNVHYYQQRFNAWDADGFLTVRDYLIAKKVDFNNEEHLEFLIKIGLTELLDLERIKLSSGQTRKLLLASALLSSPKLLILDNPYIGLDTKSRTFINDFLDQLSKQNNITIILSGQFSILPRCIVKKIILENKTIKVGSENSTIQSIKSHNKELKKIENLFKERSTKINNPGKNEYIRFSDATIKYKDKFILKDFNWLVVAGERWTLFGANGSGKSTVVSMIYADHPQIYSQKIFLFNKRFGSGRSIWDVKKEVGFTSPELHAYFRSDLSAEEVVWTGIFDKFELMGRVSQEAKFLCSALFKYYRIDHLKSLTYSSLSTGHQRICLFIRSLIKTPKILLLDEPFQGFDQENIELSRELLDRIILPYQALIFISHFEHEIPQSVDKKISLEN